MKHSPFAAVFLLAMSMSSNALCRAEAAPNFDAAKLAAVPDRLRESVARKEVAGAASFIATADKVIQVEAVGQADVAGNLPMKPDSIFWIASMSKPITATAVMMLQDEGKLSVDDPISKYIPEFANLKDKEGKPTVVTLRHALTHTSGMADVTSEESKAAKTLADLVPAWTTKPLQFAPGSRWQYCQSGINAAGRVVEIVSGQSFPEFLEKRLFGPLGMKDTTFYPTALQLPRIAKSYRITDGKMDEAAIFILDGKDVLSHDRYPAANGGLFSTAPDYGQFCRMILNHGTLDGRQYLKPETVKLMTSIQTSDLKTGFTEGNGWGLGWCVIRHPQGATADLSAGSHGHGGAYGTQAWIDAEKGVVYVLMVQRANFPNGDASEIRTAFQHASAAAIVH